MEVCEDLGYLYFEKDRLDNGLFVSSVPRSKYFGKPKHSMVFNYGYARSPQRV
jgi:uncharacterized protein YcgL (UPF0745 family)